MNVVYESDQQKGSYSVLLHIVWVILLVAAPLRGARSARKSFRSCFFSFRILLSLPSLVMMPASRKSKLPTCVRYSICSCITDSASVSLISLKRLSTTILGEPRFEMSFWSSGILSVNQTVGDMSQDYHLFPQRLGQ